MLAHAPRDLTAHERLFALMLELDLKLDALTEGERLAASFKKLGLTDKALEVYKQLQGALGDRPDLLESLAEMQRHLGDKREAVAIYRKLLTRAMENKNDEAALDYCRTICRIDPRNTEAKRLKSELESGAMDRRRRRRRTVKGFLALVAILALAAGGGTYEWKARSVHDQVRKELWEAENDERYFDALKLHDSVLDAYAWSLVARELRPERELVEDSFIKQELESTRYLGELGRLTEAVESLNVALSVTQRGENREKLSGELKRVEIRLKAEEARWEKELKDAPAGVLAQVFDPLAVPALGRILNNDTAKPDRRKAAARALGAIGGDPAVEALKMALNNSTVGEEAKAHLSQLGRPPLQALLIHATPPGAEGRATLVDWRVTNQGPGLVSFTLDEPVGHRLAVTAADDKPPDAAPAIATIRTVRLGPGEQLGGTFDLSHKMDKPGKYRVHWTLAISWSGRPAVLTATSLAIERLK